MAKVNATNVLLIMIALLIVVGVGLTGYLLLGSTSDSRHEQAAGVTRDLHRNQAVQPHLARASVAPLREAEEQRVGQDLEQAITSSRAQGNSREARQYCYKLLQIREHQFGHESETVAETLSLMGQLDCAVGNWSLAATELQQSARVYEHLKGFSLAKFAYVICLLGDTYQHMEKPEAAIEDAYRRSLEIYSKAGDEAGANQARYNLFTFLESRKEFSQAQKLREELAKTAPNSVALAMLLTAEGQAATRDQRFEDAEKSYNRALAIYQSNSNSTSQVAGVRSLLAWIYPSLHEFDKAVSSLNSLKKLKKRQKDALPDSVAMLDFRIGRALTAKGDYLGGNKAKPCKEAAVEYFEKADPGLSKENPDDWKLCVTMEATALGQLERPDKARKVWDKLRVAEVKRCGPHGIEVADVIMHLAMCDKEQGLNELSRSEVSDAVAIVEACNNNLEGDSATVQLSDNLRTQGKISQSRKLLQRLLALRRKRCGDDSLEVGEAIRRLGSLERAEGHYSLARAEFDRCVALYERYKATHGVYSANQFCADLAGAYYGVNDDRAIPLFREALAGFKKRGDKVATVQQMMSLAAILQTFAMAAPAPKAKEYNEEAAQLWHDAKARAEVDLGKTDVWYALALAASANYDAKLSKHAQASSEYAQSVKIIEHTMGAYSWSLATTLSAQGDHYFQLRHWSQAEAAFRRAYGTWQLVGDHGFEYILALRIVESLDQQKKHDEAEQIYATARKHFRILGGGDEAESLNALLAIDPYEAVNSIVSDANHIRGKSGSEEAEKEYSLAFDIRQRYFTSRHSIVSDVSRKLFRGMEQNYALEGKPLLAKQAHDRLVDIAGEKSR